MGKGIMIATRFDDQEDRKIKSIMGKHGLNRSEAIRHAVNQCDSDKKEGTRKFIVANQFIQFVEFVNEQEDLKLRAALYKRLEELRCR